MARNELIIAINHLAAERNLPRHVIIEAVEDALVSAYKRRHKGQHNLSASINMDSGAMRVFAEKKVVAEVTNPEEEITLAEAQRVNPQAVLDDVIKVDVTPVGFGRIAAQAAKQKIISHIREAEQSLILSEYQDHKGEIVQGKVQRIDRKSGTITVLLRRGEAILPAKEQIPHERLRQGQNIKAYLLELTSSSQSVLIILSRSHRDFLRRLLEQEVPEISNGFIEIKAIAREPGSRSKVAVVALQPKIDPVGSCVGMRGVRIQNVVNELNGEKIDIVEWNNDPHKYIANALNPAKVVDVILEEKENERNATVIVPNDQLSLAIGKAGQNARLAARLTGWRVDIKSEATAEEEGLNAATRHQMRMDYASKKAGSDLLSQATALLQQGLPAEADNPLLGVSLGDSKANKMRWQEAQKAVNSEEPTNFDLISASMEDESPAEEAPATIEEQTEQADTSKPEETTEAQPTKSLWDIDVPENAPVFFEETDEPEPKEQGTKRKKKGKKRRSHKEWNPDY